MTSAGNISGVNCRRENLTWMAAARVLTESVLANPGTPSSRTWPLANNPIMSRSTRYFWPTTTLLISLRSVGTNALACCTSALIALIPVFIFCDDNARWTILPADVFRKSEPRQDGRAHLNFSEAESPGKKLQIPNSKLQRSTKLQTQKPICVPFVLAPVFGVWGLRFGISVELGVWCLVFRSAVARKPR